MLYEAVQPFLARWYLMQGQLRTDDGTYGYGSLPTPDGPLTLVDFANGAAFDQTYLPPGGRRPGR